ncbi:MAG: hypothetical protein IT462_12335 [Planctomycetes bacterium]|nr:hypothetical protein [Planctomycetota bacterium]
MTLTYRHYTPDLDPAICVSVDGNAPGKLHLSHWPDNATPKELKHDLSTGICLNLISRQDMAQRLEGITTVTNNHYDTDGVCSVFTLLHTDIARHQSHVLLSAALAGDMSLFTTPEGLKVDLTLTALTKRPDSPVASERYTDDHVRRQAQYDYAVEILPKLLETPDLHADWFAEEWWRINRDLRDLREEVASLEHLSALDLAVVRCERALHEYAVNTGAGMDRILTMQTVEGGHFFDLRLTTYSWFELVSRPFRPRADWAELAATLNQRAPSVGGNWRADDLKDPTPQLAFVNELGNLAPSKAQPEVVRAAVVEFFGKHPVLDAGV